MSCQLNQLRSELIGNQSPVGGSGAGSELIVVADELVKIKKSFRKFDTAKGTYTPKLTIVICGKRHHTRFYPTRDEDADRTKNPLPGTVVDRGVTSIYHFDFFLQAHAGLQGSTKPTHYYVVHDDYGFTQDALQGLTNDVSYLFARATKAVSLVSPAYYADLACERGRCYLHPLLQGISSSGGSVTSGGEEQYEAVMKEGEGLWGGGVSEKLKDTMFYL
ncbi:Piwi domain-containing protein [Panaeolus papilionaceus]|nr:Piwi domain-containing protein [Panaeolus papilionaceus]